MINSADTIIHSPPDSLFSLFSELFIRHHVFPLQQEGRILQIGIADTADQKTISTISFHTGLKVTPIEMPTDVIASMLKRRLDTTNNYPLNHMANTRLLQIEENTANNIMDNDQSESTILFVDLLIQDAVRQQASDIHLEPYHDYYRVRFRCDGMLQEQTTLTTAFAASVLIRLKVMASLDISERRLPQDGRILLKSPNKIDIRINICPTLQGEKIVMRLLDSDKSSLDINLLGLNESDKQVFLSALNQAQGLILVTGPTGSGKTITLYSALKYLNNISRNIATVEDPVEIELPGINQVNINHKIGLHFSTVLRTLLRQDPDILMIGEIRDSETAKIAIQAAQTGHLVLSTLHANNTIDAILRLQALQVSLIDLCSIEPLIIAQRLIRKIHQNSYQGRTGVFELLRVTHSLTEPVTLKHVVQRAKLSGIKTLWENGMEKVNAGITTLSELRRVIKTP